MMGSAGVYVTLLAISVAVTVGLGLYAWRRRHEPGALAFAGLLIAMTVWSAAAAVATPTADSGAHLLSRLGNSSLRSLTGQRAVGSETERRFRMQS